MNCLSHSLKKYQLIRVLYWTDYEVPKALFCHCISKLYKRLFSTEQRKLWRLSYLPPLTRTDSELDT